MTKRLLATIAGLTLVTTTLVFSSSGSAGAVPAGCKSKEINRRNIGFGGSDIIAGDTAFAPTDDGWDITLFIKLGSASCDKVTYTGNMFVAESGALIQSQSQFGDGISDVVSFQLHATTAQAPTTGGFTCVDLSATTSNGAKLLDSAPDTGTITVCDGAGGAFRFQ